MEYNGLSWGIYTISVNASLIHPHTHELVSDLEQDLTDNEMFDGTIAILLGASVDVDPDTLNLHSQGRWITAYIELPEDYNITDIDVSTILLEGFIPAERSDIQDNALMVKFNRTEVVSWICDDLGIEYGNVSLAISGELYDGTLFGGLDVIKVLFPGDVDDDGDVDPDDFSLFSGCYGVSIGNPSYNPRADFNEDGCINPEDFSILSGNYGKTAV